MSLTLCTIYPLYRERATRHLKLKFFSCFTQQEESIEEVIKDTESLFKSREKEYQDTIDQIEVKSFCLCPNIYITGVKLKARGTIPAGHVILCDV